VVKVALYIDVCYIYGIVRFVVCVCVCVCVCSAVYPVVCASRLEVCGGVCSVKGSLKSGYIVTLLQYIQKMHGMNNLKFIIITYHVMYYNHLSRDVL